MSFPLRTWRIAPVLAVVTAAACSRDGVTSPAAPDFAARLGTSSAAMASTGKAQFHPNSRRYADTEAKPATGRSGAATLVARALLNKDGSVDLEATTGGSLDGAAARPGTITRTQVKYLLGANDTESVFTQNNNKVDEKGYVKYSYPHAVRGAFMRVQANIKDIDPKRTDVVTVLEKIKLRPDLKVTSVSAPQQARRNTEVVISAVVSEGNGDVGATGSCVLAVDGTEADRIDGQWVNNGGTVSCLFQHTFTTTGTKQLAVRSTGSVPADFDASNNVATAEINIVEANVAVSGQAQVYQERYEYTYASSSAHGYNSIAGGSPIQWYYEYAQNYGNIAVTGALPADAPSYLSTTTASVTITGESGASVSADLQLLSHGWICSYAQAANGVFAQYCDYSQFGFVQPLQYHIQHYAYDAIYYSQSYNATWDVAAGQYVHTIPAETWGHGTVAGDLGSSVTIDARLTIGSTTYRANPTVALTPFSHGGGQPYACYNTEGYVYDNSNNQVYGPMTYCQGWKHKATGRSGDMTF